MPANGVRVETPENWAHNFESRSMSSVAAMFDRFDAATPGIGKRIAYPERVSSIRTWSGVVTQRTGMLVKPNIEPMRSKLA
jgi:hypothetical protein